jgi:hypothetical protein
VEDKQDLHRPDCSGSWLLLLIALVLAWVATGCSGLSSQGTSTHGSGSALGIQTASLPNGTTGSAYSSAISAAGGTAPYRWSVSVGTLPVGLSLSSAGVLSGTPSAAAEYNFTVTVKDSSTPIQSASEAYQIQINTGGGTNNLSVTTNTLTDAVQNVAYNSDLNASGGTTPYSWTLASGTLPSGLSLDSSGVISGSPTGTGTSKFTVSVTDANQNSALKQLTLKVNQSNDGSTPAQFVNLKSCTRQNPIWPEVLLGDCNPYTSPADAMPPLYAGTPSTVYSDPIFGTNIVRVTPQPGMDPVGFVPVYAPQQPWSKDGDYMMVLGGNGYLNLMQGASPYSWVRRMDQIQWDGVDEIWAVWSNTNDCLIVFTYQRDIRVYNACTDATPTVLGTFSTLTDTQNNVLDLQGNNLAIKPYVYCNISGDDTKVASKVVDASGAVYGFGVWSVDLVGNTASNVWFHKITPPGDLVNQGTPHDKQPAEACISPNADYVEVQWNTDPNGGYNHYGTEMYRATDGTFVGLAAAPYQTVHADQMLLADGSEAFVSSQISQTHDDYRRFEAFDYATTSVVQNAYMPDNWGSEYTMQWHISGRGSTSSNGLRGWALMSTYGEGTPGVDCTDPNQQIQQIELCSEIFALKMDGSNETFRIAHPQSQKCSPSNPNDCNYFAEPHATPNRDFTKIMFGSNWRTYMADGTNLNVYVVELP